ncbi:MAG: AAA family ATPase [Sporichthyaceae bacterium]
MSADPLGFARRLIDQGVPVFAAWPDPSTDSGFRPPRRWQHTRPDPKVLERWRPGMALCAVGGHALDFVDVDPRHGGHDAARMLREADRWPTEYATVATPSGGTHHYVYRLGIAKTDRDGIDLQSGSPDGTGRGFVFIPPTVRGPNAKGKPEGPYVLLEDGLDTFGRDDVSGAAFRDWVTATSLPPTPAAGIVGPAGGMAGRLGEPIPDGRHDKVLAAYVASLAARKMTEAEALGMIELRARDCVPPWSGPDSIEKCFRTRWWPGAARKFATAVDEPIGQTIGQAPSFAILTAADVEITRVVYVWQHYIPRGAATLMPGAEGIGKTTVGVRIMADLTRGTLPGEYLGTPRDVLVIAPEDGIADVFTPRLREAGADLTRVHYLNARLAADGSAHEVILPRDLPALGQVVADYDPALIWIDSLATTLPDELKSISYKDTAKVLRAIGKWAEQARVAVVAPWHLNKQSGSDTALRIMDSRAFRTAVRSMVIVVADPDSPENGPPQGLVALDKSNAGSLAVPALRYRIRQATYTVTETDAETGEIRELPASCGVVEWIGQVDNGLETARSFLAPSMSRDNDPKAWLRDYLTHAGETPRQTVLEAGAEAGHGEKQLQRAARTLGVVYTDMTEIREGKPPMRRTGWRLPAQRAEGGQDTWLRGQDSSIVQSRPSSPSSPPLTRDDEDNIHPRESAVRTVGTVADGLSSSAAPVSSPHADDPDPPFECVVCGNELLLRLPGRDTCDRCRIATVVGPPAHRDEAC